jgi:hypothetical protein
MYTTHFRELAVPARRRYNLLHYFGRNKQKTKHLVKNRDKGN